MNTEAMLAFLTIGHLPPPPRRSAVDEVIVIDTTNPDAALASFERQALSSLTNPRSTAAIVESLSYDKFLRRPLHAAKQERMLSDSFQARRAREKRAHAKTRKAERQRRKANRR